MAGFRQPDRIGERFVPLGNDPAPFFVDPVSGRRSHVDQQSAFLRQCDDLGGADGFAARHLFGHRRAIGGDAEAGDRIEQGLGRGRADHEDRDQQCTDGFRNSHPTMFLVFVDPSHSTKV